MGQLEGLGPSELVSELTLLWAQTLAGSSERTLLAQMLSVWHSGPQGWDVVVGFPAFPVSTSSDPQIDRW